MLETGGHTILVSHKMWPVDQIVFSPVDCWVIKFVPQSDRWNGVEGR